MKLADVKFTANELLSVRLSELLMLMKDYAATAEDARDSKAEAVAQIWERSYEFAEAVGQAGEATALRSLHLRWINNGHTPTTELLDIARPVLADVRPEMRELVLLELFGAVLMPKGSKWVDRDACLAFAGSLLLPDATPSTVTSRRKRYEKAVRRLSGDTLSPAFRLSLIGGAAALTVASGGIATAVGTAIGGTMDCRVPLLLALVWPGSVGEVSRPAASAWLGARWWWWASPRPGTSVGDISRRP